MSNWLARKNLRLTRRGEYLINTLILLSIAGFVATAFWAEAFINSQIGVTA